MVLMASLVLLMEMIVGRARLFHTAQGKPAKTWENTNMSRDGIVGGWQVSLQQSTSHYNLSTPWEQGSVGGGQ